MSDCLRRKAPNELEHELVEASEVGMARLQDGVTRDKEPGPVVLKAPCLKAVRCL